MFSEIFWTFFITSIIGCLLATCRMLYKSKCSEVSFCCIKVIRDTANEEKIDEIAAIKTASEGKKDDDSNI